jgi:hypothetical protein
VTAPFPVPPAALASAGRSLAAEFPAWQIAPVRGGMWGAYWRSGDGRHRRYIVTRSAPQLLDALRTRAAISAQPGSQPSGSQPNTARPVP